MVDVRLLHASGYWGWGWEQENYGGGGDDGAALGDCDRGADRHIVVVFA
jgi:hypothetical protein